MTTCDLCKKDIILEMPKVNLCTGYIENEWKGVDWKMVNIDMCDGCRRELRDILYRAEAEFYQSKIKECGK